MKIQAVKPAYKSGSCMKHTYSVLRTQYAVSVGSTAVLLLFLVNRSPRLQIPNAPAGGQWGGPCPATRLARSPPQRGGASLGEERRRHPEPLEAWSQDLRRSGADAVAWEEGDLNRLLGSERGQFSSGDTSSLLALV